MRILILNQSFYPDFVSVAQHASDLATALADQGHAVTVVASRFAYTDPAVRYEARETWCGCTIRRLRTLGLGKKCGWRRILDSAVLLAAFFWELVRLPAFDLVVAMTHPPMIAFIASIMVRLKGGRLISWVMDLNPDEAIAANWLAADSLTARWLTSALRFSLQSSHRIVVLDSFMRKRVVAKGVPGDRVEVIPPWSHDNHIRYDTEGRNQFRRAHALAGKFVVMYSGNLSIVHPLSTLLLAAAELKERTDIVFCFVGDGNALPGVKDFIAGHHLRNVICLPYQPLDRLAASLSAADLHTVVMGNAMVGVVHPCKIYNILALGVPVLHIGPHPNHICEIIDSVEADGAAYHAAQGDVVAVVDAILDAAEKRLGTIDALRLASTPFSQAALTKRFLQLLNEVGPRAASVPSSTIDRQPVGPGLTPTRHPIRDA